MDKRMTTKMIVEGGVLIALAQILSYIKVYEGPYGGSVTAGSMVPIFIYAIRWGLKPGIMVGTVYGILQFILGPKYSYHVISILFDYIFAFGILGFAGVFHDSKLGSMTGIFIGILGRFVCHVISGAVVFASYAPKGLNPWLYSSMYNLSYLAPELLISIVVITLLYRPLKRVSLASS